MPAVTLDLDSAQVVNFIFTEKNYYKKTFRVTKGGVNYDWDGVTGMTFIVKKSTINPANNIELSLAGGGIEKSEGVMILNFTGTDTAIAPGEYKVVELTVDFEEGTKTWWAGGFCQVKKRGKA